MSVLGCRSSFCPSEKLCDYRQRTLNSWFPEIPSLPGKSLHWSPYVKIPKCKVRCLMEWATWAPLFNFFVLLFRERRAYEWGMGRRGAERERENRKPAPHPVQSMTQVWTRNCEIMTWANQWAGSFLSSVSFPLICSALTSLAAEYCVLKVTQ